MSSSAGRAGDSERTTNYPGLLPP